LCFTGDNRLQLKPTAGLDLTAERVLSIQWTLSNFSATRSTRAAPSLLSRWQRRYRFLDRLCVPLLSSSLPLF
jgi:hypothetical protein